jgi:hypothetical protein
MHSKVMPGSQIEVHSFALNVEDAAHGVGLIRMTDPDDSEAYEIVIDPKRKQTPGVTVDGFLESRLSDSQRQTLARALNGGGR